MGMKVGGGSGDDEPISEMNVVPLVDIILVVLIIFMVTTPILIKPSIQVDLPKAVSGEETTPGKLNITITEKGELLLNGAPANEDEISKFSSDIINKKPNTQAIISADKSVSHGQVVSIIDLVRTAGIQKFAISIDKN